MKKSIYRSGIFSAAAFAVLFVSCSKDYNYPSAYPNGGNSSGQRYPLTISAGSGEEATRASLDLLTNVYYWTANDKVGLSIASAAVPATAVIHNLSLTSTNTAPDTHAIFKGDLTESQLSALDPEGTYNYYSYFPYNAAIGGTFPSIGFVINSGITVTPNYFDPNLAPMVADPRTNLPPVVYFSGSELTHGDLVHFDYKHIMSYAAIDMDCNLMSQKVTSITITNNSGTRISGTYSYNMSTGSGSYTSGSTSITVTVSGGLNVGQNNVLYIPMPPVNMSGQTFTFQFNGPTGNVYKPVTIPGANFAKGKIHKLYISSPVEYYADDTFTINKAGNYYIEAWGGNGGTGGKVGSGIPSGGNGGAAGTGLRQAGFFHFNVGDILYVQVGTAGGNGTNGASGSRGTGGAAGAGTWFGSGFRGGNGGNSSLLYSGGGGAGAGGGASGVLLNGTGVSNIILASGGAGGGGGSGQDNGGAGGNSGLAGSTVSGNGGGGTTWSGTSTVGVTSTKIDGANATILRRGDGGGGGGGGGFNGASGGGGTSGIGGLAQTTVTSGGGGAGGLNHVSSTAISTSGYNVPTNNRPGSRADGYVVITFIR